MKKYTIGEVCKELGITRQGLNARCRKLGIEKIKEGRNSYLTTQHIKLLGGGSVSTKSKKTDTERLVNENDGNERLITRLTEENDYLRKKLDEESEKVKGSLNVIFQQTERIGKLETENSRLLPYAPLEDIVENDVENKQKRKRKTWWGKVFRK